MTQGSVPFSKWQGTGNDFILVDLDLVGEGQARRAVATWQQAASALCDRHFGVGADGILLLGPHPAADFEMVVINADGSIAEMCGNGLRCAARYWARRSGSPGALGVATGAGLLGAAVQSDGRVKVDMGPAGLNPADIPVLAARGDQALLVRLDPLGLDVSCVSLGNPHAVAFVADLDRVDLATLGPAVSTHSRFPLGVNAGFAQVMGPHDLRLAVWERGVGATLACGTGACAAVVAGISTGRLEAPVLVHLAGGDLEIDWSPGRSVFMTGAAEPVFDGTFDSSWMLAKAQAR